MEKRKFLNIKTIGAILAAALIMLIFFSKTIYNYNLPVVTATMPERGKLNKIELANGIAAYSREFDIYSDIAGEITEILVKEGDSVKAGDPLILMDFGSSRDDIGTELEKAEYDTHSKLLEADVNTKKISVDIEKLELNISNAERKISELQNESYTPDVVSDYELAQCADEISKAKESLEKTEALFQAGAVPKGELINAERALESLQSRYAHLEEAYKEQVRKSTEQFTEMVENRKKQIADLEYQISGYTKDLETKKLELQNIKNQKEKLSGDFSFKAQELENSISEYESNGVIRAKRDAVITALNVRDGQFIGANQKLLTCGVAGDYVVECRVSLDNNFISAGDSCRLGNTSHTLSGTVLSIKTLETAKLITVSIEGEDISSGETFDIRFEKTSAASYMLVPKGALNMDSDGYFLNILKRRDGIMGKEFYTEKLRVYIGDSDNDYVAIIKGVDFPEPVALISDKPFIEGETVKLKNESDFFEN